jgi:hypothetical protein
MDLWDALLILRKRWYVVAPVLALTALLLVTTSGRIASDYRASASILLVAPGTPTVSELDDASPTTGPDDEPDDADASGVNQFITFPGTLKTMAEATALSVASQGSLQRIREAGGRADLKVAASPNSPIVEVTATDRDPDLALRTMSLAVDSISADLTARQSEANVASSGWITAQVLNRPETAIADPTSQLRVRLAILGIGVALTVAVAVAVEGFSERHHPDRNRRGRTSGDDAIRPEPPAVSRADQALAPPDPAHAGLRMWRRVTLERNGRVRQ